MRHLWVLLILFIGLPVWALPLNAKDKTKKQETQLAITIVNSLIEFPDAQKVIIRNTSHDGDRFLGQYDGSHTTIFLMPDADNWHERALVSTHEIGHYIDHCVLGGDNYATYIGPDDMRLVLASIHQTIAVQHIAAVLISGADKDHEAYLVYLLDSAEEWARAFAQWAALRSGDATLKKELDLTRKREFNGGQWEDDDFLPVAKSIDVLLAGRKLLKTVVK